MSTRADHRRLPFWLRCPVRATRVPLRAAAASSVCAQAVWTSSSRAAAMAASRPGRVTVRGPAPALGGPKASWPRTSRWATATTTGATRRASDVRPAVHLRHRRTGIRQARSSVLGRDRLTRSALGREGSLATDRETRDDALLVPVADDVDHVPVWGAHEEPADAPRFVGQRMNDLVAAALRFRVGLVDVVPDVH
jgi:hypothetical protein